MTHQKSFDEILINENLDTACQKAKQLATVFLDA